MDHTKEILNFYRDGKPNPEGRLLTDIWKYDPMRLEHVHNYIQWLFPINEPSYFNRDTPKLTPEVVEIFLKDSSLKVKMIKSFIVMLTFYGLKLEYNEATKEYSATKSQKYDERKENWQTGMNHNFLRITRILNCLNTLGLEKLGKAFYDCLMILVKEGPEGFNELSISYWQKAMEGK